jgi:hypothetical protein
LAPSHRLLAATAATAHTVLVTHEHRLVVVAVTAVAATATSAGWTSPDVDQSWLWVTARKGLPNAIARLFNHRTGLAHWWGIPVLAWLFWLPTVPAVAQATAAALILGWGTHLLGDAIFGKIGLLPGVGPAVGLGLDTGGWIETGKSRRRWVPDVPVSPLRVALAGALLYLTVAPTVS